MTNIVADALWVERYRPQTIDDVIMPERLKNMFKSYVTDGTVPNMLISGTAGIGKTTVAKAMLKQIDADYIVINGSLNAGIDVIRNDVTNFASSISFGGGRKYVIFDEADQLSETVQKALRGFIEEFSANCGFIFTANYKGRIIEPLHSRLPSVDIVFTQDEVAETAAEFYKQAVKILKAEKVEFDRAVVAEIVRKVFPDFRKTLGILQQHSRDRIDSGVLYSLKNVSMEELFSLLKAKDFTGMRKWAGENSDQDYSATYKTIYNEADKYIQSKSMPGVIVTMSEYMDKHTRAIDPEINFVAFLTEIMFESSFVE